MKRIGLLLLLLLLTPVAAAATTPPSHDPYAASLAYAKCMRAHGVPHPDPDRTGEFHLTAAEERLLKAVPTAQRKAADRACVSTLKGLDNRPLTHQAHLRALRVLRQVAACMKRHGHQMGPPIVKNLSNGRAMFGFQGRAGNSSPSYLRDQHGCEKRVRLAHKLAVIIAEDRSHI
jgi:hypothetical protein